MTEAERLLHYSELATQYREWASTETNEEARAGLLDMARQYERLTIELKAKSRCHRREAAELIQRPSVGQ